ncbi:hypothetical protein GGF44_006634 [Coemansia sp. RSA 1694]|nr:hypothetical protein GGF38_006187 [Coemansia sp. RSA 25]KAJ2479293.1 hypothetical protein IWW47_006036 [Coemansia sp. RSA 2052]KAJ2546742.1 hypothetical protein GGH95_006773 [Coemansia sp. RSA 1836]KAJ2605441.1 hypothetical protein GGF44_006634 [Coemansia sp. RSA 1694]
MAEAYMELDSPEQQQPREPEEDAEGRAAAAVDVDAADVVVAATAVITPPHSTSNTPQRSSGVAARDIVHSSEQLNREIDSAAPESPGGSLYYGDIMEGISSSDEDKNGEAAEMSHPPTRPGRRGLARNAARRLDMDDAGSVDESERIEHTDFFNSFGQDWLIIQ